MNKLLMKLMKEMRLLPLAYVIMLLVMFILPFFSFPDYSIVKNTTSHLGAQNTPGAAIMNVTFILLGFAAIWDGWRLLEGYWLHRIVLLIFGSSLILCAFFQHAPIIEAMSYNVQKDWLHSVFANSTGFSFTVFAISAGFILKSTSRRIIAFSVGILAVALSLLMFNIDSLMGIWQRLIFIISFAWMLYFFNIMRSF